MMAAAGNQKGYFEDIRIVRVHDLLLSRFGLDWKSLADFPEGWWKKNEVQEFQNSLRNILSEEFLKNPLCLVKDPRLCRLLPLWRALFKELQISPFTVLVVRHPDEVAASLSRRDGLPENHSYLLWAQHLLEAENYSRGWPRVWIDYQSLLNNWRETFNHILNSFGLEGILTASHNKQDLDNFIDPALRHHRSEKVYTPESENIFKRLAFDCYEAFQRAETTEDLAISLEPLRSEMIRQVRAVKAWSVEERPKSVVAITGDKYSEFDPGEHPSTEAANPDPNKSYRRWLKLHHPAERELVRAIDQVRKWPEQPVFHCVVTLMHEEEQNNLADTIDGIAAQYYEHWRLLVVTPLPCPDSLWQELPQLAWHQMDSKSTLAEALNKALAAIDAHWVWLLKPGDRLESHALLSFAEAVHAHPGWRLIYSDEGRISPQGEFHSPHFKPDFNLDLLRANDYLGPVMVRRDALLEVGGIADLPGAEDYDLALRMLEIWGEKGFGHLAEVLVHRPDQDASVTSERSAAQTRAVKDHLARCEVSAKVREGFLAGTRSIQYPLDKTPRVSILIPTKDRLELLQPCVESVLEKTDYPDFEIIVIDNQSRERETLDYLEQLTIRDSRVRVLPYPHTYNFSAINNAAAEVATGEFLLLLNNDTVILQENWLERLMRHGLRSEVGAVGARLVYPNGTVQHAGVILGMGGVGVAEHWHIGSSLDDPGYMGRLQLVQNLSAVTAACLLVRKSLYREIGGLNPERYQVLFNDIDFCLRLRQRDYLVVWTPEVTVMHHGSGSLGSEYDPKGQQRAIHEKDAMLEDWLPVLARDPAYNQNLSLRDRTPALESKLDVPWTHLRCDTLKIVGMPLDDAGIGEYRMRAPVRQLMNTGAVSSKLLPSHAGESNPLRMSVTELVRAAPDVVFLHEALTDPYVDLWETYRRYTDVFRIYSQDDLIFQLPSQHPLAGKNKDSKKRLRKMLRMSDRLIVGTQPMAQALEGMIEDIRVVPNRLERARWGNIESHRRKGGKPRVGWAGAIQHHADLMFLLPVLETTAPEVDWIFLGMCPEPLRSYVAEFHSGVAFNDYPEKLADLDLDLAVAPLERNKYNEAKSNLRLLEYGILGWPVICTDIYPYQYENPPVCRLPNQPDLWIKAIRERVNEPDALAKEGEQLRDWVRKSWILEDHLDEWLTALTPTRSPDGSLRLKIPNPGRS